VFLKERKTGELVEVLDVREVCDPFQTGITGRYNAGEELPDPGRFVKTDLVFCSGEPLPRCWTDPDYRRDEIRRTGTHH